MTTEIVLLSIVLLTIVAGLYLAIHFRFFPQAHPLAAWLSLSGVRDRNRLNERLRPPESFAIYALFDVSVGAACVGALFLAPLGAGVLVWIWIAALLAAALEFTGAALAARYADHTASGAIGLLRGGLKLKGVAPVAAALIALAAFFSGAALPAAALRYLFSMQLDSPAPLIVALTAIGALYLLVLAGKPAACGRAARAAQPAAVGLLALAVLLACFSAGSSGEPNASSFALSRAALPVHNAPEGLKLLAGIWPASGAAWLNVAFATAAFLIAAASGGARTLDASVRIGNHAPGRSGHAFLLRPILAAFVATLAVLLLPAPDAILAGPALWPALGAVLLLSALQFTGAGETGARALADGITPAAGRIFTLFFPFLLLAAGFWSAMSAESTFLIWRGLLLWGGLALLVTLIANFLIVDLGVREYARYLEQEGQRAKRGAPLLLLLSLLPSNLLSRLFGVISRLPVPRALRPVVYGFYSRKFGVNLAEAARPLDEYPSLGQFFIRYLKPGLRPIDARKNAAISPVDGTLAQFGPIVSGAMIQAKGLDYSLYDLLPDCEFAREFEGGAFCTIYLSPRDYHRIHTPCAGELVGYDYVPGYLLPVNLLAVENVRDLFPKNERLTTFLRQGSALVAVVKVGATNVGRIRLAYDEHVITNGWRRSFHPRQRYAAPRAMECGAELARFEMGSTVVLLFSKGALKWQAGLRENSSIRLGESLGTISG